jgi:polyisoprenoid-binding protein YceI
VSKTGVFSGFADNHEVEARIAKGTLDAKSGQLRLSVDSRQMRVLDPQLPPDKRRQVQERMLGPEVLDSTHFPEIIFESTHVKHDQEGVFVVNGRLSLHGVTKPISLVAHLKNGRYTGTFALKQRDFGIIPVSVAGGTVKVKDELTIEFDIAASPGEKEN